MSDTDKIKELRSLVPIPLSEAKKLLQLYEGDVEMCAIIFKENSLWLIRQQTDCDIEMAQRHYELEKQDINRAISAIREELFDRSYQPIEGVNREKLSYVVEWMQLEESEDLITSLDYPYLNDIVTILFQIPAFAYMGELVSKVVQLKKQVLGTYGQDDNLTEHVKRHAQLISNPEYIELQNTFLLNKTVFKEELYRHFRNS